MSFIETLFNSLKYFNLVVILQLIDWRQASLPVCSPKYTKVGFAD